MEKKPWFYIVVDAEHSLPTALSVAHGLYPDMDAEHERRTALSDSRTVLNALNTTRLRLSLLTRFPHTTVYWSIRPLNRSFQ